MPCTIISNNYAINFAISPCSGTYTGVVINNTITIGNGVTLTLNNVTAGPSAEIIIETNGTLNLNPPIGGGNTITIPNITIKGIGKLTVGGNLVSSYIDASLSSVPTGVAVRLTVNGNLDTDGGLTMGSKSATNITGNLTMADSFSFDSTATLLIGGNLTIVTSYGGSFDGRVGVTLATTFGAGISGGIIMNACRFQTATLVNNAPANQITGTGYFKVNSSFTGANALTNVSTIRIYKASGSGNVGSATVLGSPISPEPC